jgi:peptidyl-tRNA hydrolase
MYSFLNRGLGMTTGKVAAQAQHAAVEAYCISKPTLIEQWRLGGHYTKLVMLAEDDVHLLVIQKYIEERGFSTKLIIDEGRTEIRPHSPTALGVEVVDRDDPHVAATFEEFKLYKEKHKHRK